MATVTTSMNSHANEEKEIEPLPWTSPPKVTLQPDKSNWSIKLFNFDYHPNAIYAFASLKPNDLYIIKITAWEQLKLPERINWAFHTDIQFNDDKHATQFMYHIMMNANVLPK